MEVAKQHLGSWHHVFECLAKF
jgi:hypothetical protein